MYCFTHWAEAEDHEADETCSDTLDVGIQNRGVIAPMPMYAYAMAAAAAQQRERETSRDSPRRAEARRPRRRGTLA
jgi:hypothetical protein